MSEDLREMIRETMHEASQAEAPVVSQDDGGPPPTDEGGDTSATTPDVQATAEESSATEKPTVGRARDASGKFAKAEKTATPAPKQPKEAPAVTPVPKTASEPTQTPVPVSGTETTAFKPPQSWKPAAREALLKADPSIQQEVARREREITAALQEASERGKRGDALSHVMTPFENHLRRQGEDPAKAVHNMMQFRYNLETGSDETKVDLVAGLIQGFRINIAKLDERLAAQSDGQSRTQQPSYTDPQSIAEQVEARMMERLQQQRQSRLVEKANTDLQAFVKDAEFFDVGPSEDGSFPSVRDAMQGLLRGGVVKTYKAAYDWVCDKHPDVAPILAQRQAAKAATSANEATQRQRAAATSIRNEPSVARPEPAADSIRGALREAFAERNRR